MTGAGQYQTDWLAQAAAQQQEEPAMAAAIPEPQDRGLAHKAQYVAYPHTDRVSVHTPPAWRLYYHDCLIVPACRVRSQCQGWVQVWGPEWVEGLELQALLAVT
jgi:hypothetical protein